MCPALRVPDLPDQVLEDRCILFVCHEYIHTIVVMIDGYETHTVLYIRRLLYS